MNKKVLKKIYTPNAPGYAIQHAFLIDYINNRHEKALSKPKGKENYVGIEIECFTSKVEAKVYELLLEFDLEKHVDVAGDSSIEPDYEDGRSSSYEFRILSSEKQLPGVLKKLAKFLEKGEFKVNDSCGLHVHIDMRNRKVDKCYSNLLKFQDVLFGVVDPARWDSDFCSWSTEEVDPGERFKAINKTAYKRHKTLEVRLHHGSVDVKEIGNWIKLLLRCVKYNAPVVVKSKNDAMKLMGNNKALRSYIKGNFAPRWFKDKPEVLRAASVTEEDEYIDYGNPSWGSANL
jgi:hypothetical protein